MPLRTLARTLLVAIAACSNETTPSARVPSFADLDVSHDGLLSRSETIQVPQLAQIFTAADADKDRELSVEEFSAATLEHRLTVASSRPTPTRTTR
jgi:hypothetical protein